MEGVVYVSGVIGAGDQGREASWVVPGMCDVQVSIVPSFNLS